MGHQARRHRSMRWAAAAALVLGVVVGTSAVASAKAAKGSTQWCAHHVKKCAAGGSGTGSGTGGTPPELTIQIDPNPVVETATSAVAVVVQVEADPAFAGDPVDVSSSQLDAACALAVGFNAQPLFELGPPLTLTLTLDDDGNATVAIIGQDCAPGSDLVEASMAVAPFLTATDVLDVSPPQVTPAGVYGSPTTSGSVAGEVETGDTVTSGDSDVAAVFNIETDPVYAEQPVEIDWNELQSRCLRAEGIGLIGPSFVVIALEPGGVIQPNPQETLDDDGNATFLFFGSSCAAGPSDIIADVLAGTHPTYTTTFTIDPPQVTI